MITFGIMTRYENIPQLIEVVNSIHALHIPHYEIILAGSYSTQAQPIPGTKHIVTDGWTPVKKNLVAKLAEFETLVLLHDYFVFAPDWYERWTAFNAYTPWEIGANPQVLIDGSRHATDWVIWDHPTLPRYHSLDYDDGTQTQYQYVSGGFFLVKRDFLRANPFNEDMKPGSAEDVEWSLRVRRLGRLVCNPLAVVRHNKIHRDVGNKIFPLYANTTPL